MSITKERAQVSRQVDRGSVGRIISRGLSKQNTATKTSKKRRDASINN